jgi:hypothetical protein
VADLAWTAAKQGKDLRGLLNYVGIADEDSDEDTGELPQSVAEIKAMSKEQLIALVRRCEAEIPFPVTCQHCGERLEQKGGG